MRLLKEDGKYGEENYKHWKYAEAGEWEPAKYLKSLGPSFQHCSSSFLYSFYPVAFIYLYFLSYFWCSYAYFIFFFLFITAAVLSIHTINFISTNLVSSSSSSLPIPSSSSSSSLPIPSLSSNSSQLSLPMASPLSSQSALNYQSFSPSVSLPVKSSSYLMTDMAFSLIVQFFPPAILTTHTLSGKRGHGQLCPIQISLIKQQVLSHFQGKESDWEQLVDKLMAKLRNHRGKLLKRKTWINLSV